MGRVISSSFLLICSIFKQCKSAFLIQFLIPPPPAAARRKNWVYTSKTISPPHLQKLVK